MTSKFRRVLPIVCEELSSASCNVFARKRPMVSRVNVVNSAVRGCCMIHLAYDAGVVRPGTIAAGIDSGGEIRLDLKKYPVLHASTAALSLPPLCPYRRSVLHRRV